MKDEGVSRTAAAQFYSSQGMRHVLPDAVLDPAHLLAAERRVATVPTRRAARSAARCTSRAVRLATVPTRFP